MQVRVAVKLNQMKVVMEAILLKLFWILHLDLLNLKPVR